MAMEPQAPPPLFGPSSGAAEVHRGGANCLQRLEEILEENGLPTGHLPFDGGILELGYNRENGFVWVKQRERKQHYFPRAKLTIVYEAEVTGYLQWRGMKKIKGVAARKLFLNVNAVEFSVDGDPVGGNICVKTSLGLSQVLPASALQLLED